MLLRSLRNEGGLKGVCLEKYNIYFPTHSLFGARFFQKQENDGVVVSLDSTVVSEGVVVAQVSSTSSVSQLLSITSGDELAGSTLTIPPGSLAIDMNIVMEPGTSMLTDTFLNEIDLSEAGDVSSGSEALLIEPDKPVDPVGSLAISIPLSASPLAVFSYSNYSVVYTAFDYKNNRKIAGVMPYDQIKIEGNLARFNVNYFGMYQVIKTEAKITKKSVLKLNQSLIPSVMSNVWSKQAWRRQVYTTSPIVRLLL